MSIAPDSKTPPTPVIPAELMRLPVGVASPLWGLFAGAAVTGAAWWWMTRWARPENLEAMFSQTARSTEAVLKVVEAEVAALPEPGLDAGPVVEEIAAAAEAAGEVVEAVAEPAVDAVEAAPDVTEAIVEPVIEAIEAAPEQVVDTVEAVTTAVEVALETASETAVNASEAVAEALFEVPETMGDVVGGESRADLAGPRGPDGNPQDRR